MDFVGDLVEVDFDFPRIFELGQKLREGRGRASKRRHFCHAGSASEFVTSGVLLRKPPLFIDFFDPRGAIVQGSDEFPTDPAARPGRGRKGTYSFGDLMKFVISLELIQGGMMPKAAADIVNGSWSLLRVQIYLNSWAPEELKHFTRPPERYLWMVRPEALRSLSRNGEGKWDHMERVITVPIAEAAQELSRGVDGDSELYGQGYRTLVLNGYDLTQRVMKVIAFYMGYASRDALRADLEEEVDAFNADLKRFGDQLKDLPPPTPEQAERAKLALARMDETDWSTTPPTPRHVLLKRADELIPLLSQPVKDFLSKPGNDGFTIDNESEREAVIELLRLKVLSMAEIKYEGDLPPTLDDLAQSDSNEVRVGMSVTAFGRVLIKRLGGPWAEQLHEEDKNGKPDPLAEAADEVIAKLSEEARTKIPANDHAALFQEPLRSELQSNGLVVFTDAPFPHEDAEAMQFTGLGRAVLYALRDGPHRHLVGNKLEF